MQTITTVAIVGEANVRFLRRENMIEVATAISIFDRLLNVFGLVKAGKIIRDEKVDLALRKTHQALVETQAYIRITDVQQRDHSKEQELANLWYEASIPMRHLDKKLAKICSLKGGYWSNPDSWDDIRSGESNISLDNVEKLTYELLSNK